MTVRVLVNNYPISRVDEVTVGEAYRVRRLRPATGGLADKSVVIGCLYPCGEHLEAGLLMLGGGTPTVIDLSLLNVEYELYPVVECRIDMTTRS